MLDPLFSLLGDANLFAAMKELFTSEVAKMTIAFGIAAKLHQSWVRKDMAEQFAHITAAINNVAASLNHELARHSQRIDDLSGRVEKLEKR